MGLDLDDTIAAIASAAGGAARGIVRISGPGAFACVAAIFRARDAREGGTLARSASEGERGNAVIPRLRYGLVSGVVVLPTLGAVPARAYLWPTSRSYTRQPSAELHLLSSPPILEAALAAVCAAGARLARPGEFTLRAFLAGRLDLTQAEAVLGVIEAAGQQDLATALAQLAGGLARPLSQLREALLDLLAHLEAGLDFVEEDIEFITPAELTAQLNAAQAQVAAIAQQLAGRGEAGELPTVVLAGLPNAGKSSLFNALAGAGSAIVSPLAGTTRDFVARPARLGDRECLLIDTAGLGEGAPDGVVTHLAAEAARQQLREADLVLLCREALKPEAPAKDHPAPSLALQASIHAALVVWTKCDLLSPGAAPPEGGLPTSSRTGQGLDELWTAVAQRLDARAGEAGVVAGTADRCRQSLRLAEAALARASTAARAAAGPELVAAEVRLALEELGQVVGAVYTEDLLDRVFSRFCIGK
jgi:tRNA modification GTPase